MAVISSEGGLFDMAAGQYSDHVNIDILLKAFTGDPVMIDRKGRPSEQIDRPCLTMLLTVQPSVLQAVMENVPSGEGVPCQNPVYAAPFPGGGKAV